MHLYAEINGSFPSGYIYHAPPAPGGIIFPPPAPGGSKSQRIDRKPPKPPAPPGGGPSQSNGSGWGWAALILDQIEQGNLARQINYTLPVEAVSNLSSRTALLTIYTCPSDLDTGAFTVQSETNAAVATAATNSYAACFGAGYLLNTQPDNGNGMFYRNSATRFLAITDGTSNTIAVGDRASLFAQGPWAGVMTDGTIRTTPGAPVYSSIVESAPGMVLARMGPHMLNATNSEPYDFFSPHGQVVEFLFADGSVHSVSIGTSLTVLQALATISGGETVDESGF